MHKTFSSSGTTFVAILLAAGCSSSPQRVTRTTVLNPEPVVVAEVKAPEPVIVAPVEVAAPPVLLPPPVTNAPPILPKKAPPLRTGWIHFDDWRRTNGWPEPSSVPGNEGLRFTLPAGKLDVMASSRFVRWNNTLVALGMIPRTTKSGLEFHSLDIQKTLLALSEPCELVLPSKVLVLDAGHGGHDGGTRSPHRTLLEKEASLDWALRVQRHLRGSGWTVLLTRTNDIDVSLPQRIAFCESARPDLFVSLHFNATPAGSAAAQESGIETYCLTPTGLPSTIAREFEDDPAKVFPNNDFDCENIQWALRFHKKILAATGARDRGVRRARFMAVVREQRRPAVLIEGGYLSNAREAKLLSQDEYREKLAGAVASAILQP